MSGAMSSEATPPPPPAPAKSGLRRFLGIARVVLVVLVVLAAGWQVYANWGEVARTVTDLQWHRVALAFVALLIGITLSTISWMIIVDDLGRPIGLGRGSQIFLVGQLGKYLPGSVWAYILQLELGRRAGLARARVFTATVFNLAIIVVAALLAGAMAVGPLVNRSPRLDWLPWLYLALPFALAMLHPKVLTALANFGFRVLRRPRPDHPIGLRTVALSLLSALGCYLAYGVHLWLLADTWQGLTFEPLFLCIGTMAIAMIAGLVAFMLPSGVGAREFVIIAALTPLVGIGPATAYAAVSRLQFVLADLLTAGGAAGLAVWSERRRGHYSGDPGID